MVKLEIVSKETIRPLSSTPPELRNLPLCLFDQQAPNVYIEILYFYRRNNVDPGHGQQLKDSLSKALTFYYPFAGRLRDGGGIIDCNDMGVTFSEAKLHCRMSEFTNTIHSKREKILKLICLDDMNGKLIPSRVQILTAFIYKAALSAKRSVTGNLPPTSLLQLINLRTRVEPPLPVTLSGNIISFFIASSTIMEQREIELWNLVGDVKKNFEEYCKKFPKDYKAEEWSLLQRLDAKESLERWRNPKDCILYVCTSWCKFRIYDADFGWGKPKWITIPSCFISNMMTLIDARDGEGVEAIVSLEKEEMAAFEQNEELLSFCDLKNFSSNFYDEGGNA